DFKLLNVPEVIKITSYGRSGTAIFACTVFGVVCIELLTGILMGLGLSAAILMYRMSQSSSTCEPRANASNCPQRLLMQTSRRPPQLRRFR
ncbi:MAG: hypothetical protein GWP91_05840, partial [Rhodobacterales bacterium]|nr:hypothetical protein [Rhodobacterales bacterium]